MSVEENKTLVRRFINEVYAAGNADRAGEFISDGIVDHSPFPGAEPTLDGFKKGLKEWLTAFSDRKVTIDLMVGEGDLVAVRSTETGRHTGPLMGNPATGKSAKLTGVDIHRIQGGKIVEHWGDYDSLGMLQQLGLVPHVFQPATT